MLVLVLFHFADVVVAIVFSLRGQLHCQPSVFASICLVEFCYWTCLHDVSHVLA